MKRVIAGVLMLSLVTMTAMADPREDRRHELEEDIQRKRIVESVAGGVGLLLIVGGAVAVEPGTNPYESPVALGIVAGGLGLLLFAGVHALFSIPLVRERHAIDQELALERFQEIEAENQARLEATYTPREVEAINNETIFVGMSEAALQESWGWPIDINRTVTSSGERKQYVYPNQVYVYVENGVVTGWQD